MVVMSLVNLCFLTALEAPPARADFTFGKAITHMVRASVQLQNKDACP